MSKALEQLTAGEWAVLALLDEQSTHGFALARALEPEGEVGRVWSVRRPLVYRALETLERKGLVAPVETLPSLAGRSGRCSRPPAPASARSGAGGGSRSRTSATGARC